MVEREICSKVDLWERLNGKQFVMHDMQYVEFMERQKMEYKEEKEAKRNAKKATNLEEIAHNCNSNSKNNNNNNPLNREAGSECEMPRTPSRRSGSECENPRTPRRSSASTTTATPRKVSTCTPRGRVACASSMSLSKGTGYESKGSGHESKGSGFDPRKKTQRALSNVT